MPLRPSPLERWFTTHPGPYRHALAGTQVAPPAWHELARYLPAEFAVPVGYSEPAGDPALREAVAAFYGVAPEQVLLAHGAADANFLALSALVRPGDEVVCQTPLYPQLPLVSEGLGAVVRPWAMPAEESEPLDLSALAGLVSDRTRAVVLNSPHNPTGRVISREELAAIARLAEARPHCHVLVDEVYRGVGAGSMPASALDVSERGVVTGSLSKAWALPGLRVGWMVGPAALVEAALPHREHGTLALSSASEAIALALWPHLDALRAEVAAIAERNRGVVRAWLADNPRLRGTVPPSSGCFLLRPGEGFDDVAEAERWYEEERLFVVPASTIGYPGALRIGFGHRDEAALAAALAALEDALR